MWDFLQDSVSLCVLYSLCTSLRVSTKQQHSHRTQRIDRVPGKPVAACTGDLPLSTTLSVTTSLSANLTTLLTPDGANSVLTEDHVPFSSPLRLRKSCVVAFIHLSALLSVSLGRKARWTLERSASAAAPTEGCFFIIVRLQTDAAWRAGWLSQHTVTCWGGATSHMCTLFYFLINTNSPRIIRSCCAQYMI